MLSAPHETPWRDIPTAARTVTSVMSTTNPVISYVYDSPTPLTSVPAGKRELMSIWLYQLRSNGYVLSIDDGNKKCVGVAVWTGPRAKASWWTRLANWVKLVGLDIWMLGANLWYRGAGMNAKRKAAYAKEANEIQKEILGDSKDVYYLAFVAVQPSYQGQGIGKALIKYVTDLADQEGRKCYLNTSLYKPNVAIYGSLGFKLGKVGRIEDGGETMEVLDNVDAIVDS